MLSRWIGLSALNRLGPFYSWGVAPGWYGLGLRPSRNGTHFNPHLKNKKSAEGANYISLGQRPRKGQNEKEIRAVGPFHRILFMRHLVRPKALEELLRK